LEGKPPRKFAFENVIGLELPLSIFPSKIILVRPPADRGRFVS